MTHSNPPIAGHHLLYEGRCWLDPASQKFTDPYYGEPRWDEVTRDMVMGGCQCGALPDPFSPRALPSMTRMRVWHRQHKEELRAQGIGVIVTDRVDRVKLMHQVLDDAETALRMGDM
jgi:hypothetical protein